MSFWNRIFSRAAGAAPEGQGNMFAMLTGGGEAPRRGTSELIRLFNTSPWMRQIVGKISQQVGSVEWKLYARGSGVRTRALAGTWEQRRSVRKSMMRGKAATVREVESHPILDLLTRPNPEMSGVDLVELVQAWLDIKDEAFIVKERAPNGQIVELWPLPPHWITNVPDARHASFRVSSREWSGDVAPEDMIWLRRPNPEDPYGRPQGYGDALADEFDSDENAAKYAKAFFRNNAKPDALVAVANVKNAAQLLEAKAKWESENRGVGRAHRLHWTSGEIKVHELSKGLKDAHMLELREFARDTVAQVYGVSPELFGKLDSSNRATITQALRILAVTVVMPRAERLRMMLQSAIVEEFDQRLELDYESPLPEDRDFKLEVLKVAPWSASINEWRELREDQPLEEGGDVYVVPANLVAVPSLAMLSGSAEGDAGAEGAPQLGAAENVQQTALNGAQVQALVLVLQAVANGQLPRESAVQLLMISFQLTQQQATALLGPIGSSFFVEDTPSPAQLEAARAHVLSIAGRPTNVLALAGHKAIEFEDLLEELQPVYLSQRLDPVWKRNVEKWGKRAQQQIGIAPEFDMRNPFVEQHLRELSSDRIKGINATTKSAIRDTLADGLMAGEDMRELRKRVQAVFEIASNVRATTIARTETGRSANFATDHAWRTSGIVPARQWVATPDDRTRDEHATLDGKIVPMDEPFRIDGDSAMFPGEFERGENSINCRCTLSPVLSPTASLDTIEARAAFWNDYDKTLGDTWEADAKRALRQGFGAQRAAFLDAFDAKFGTGE